MTSNSNLKKQAREYAQEHGVSYAQARREIIENANASEIGPSGPLLPQRVVTIQQEQRTDGVLPYPFFINEHGFVGRQDFWRGQAFRLIGFVDDPDSFKVTLGCEDFLADPDAAHGKHPVFADRDGEFATYPGQVASTPVHFVPGAPAASVTVEYNFPGLAAPVTVGVGHLMGLLHSADFNGPMSDGRVSQTALREMLGWLRIDDAGQGLDLFDALDDLYDDVEVSASISTEQASAWVAARTRRPDNASAPFVTAVAGATPSDTDR